MTVSGTATTSGIDFTLDPGAATVSGTITESGTGTPIVDDGTFNSQALLISADRATYYSVALQAGGNYSFPKLRPGSYRLMATAGGYIGKVVSGLAPVATRDCLDADACAILDTGVAINVPTAGAVTGLNFTLERGASFSGNVRTAVGATAISGANVTLTNATTSITSTTDVAGGSLPAGAGNSYYAATTSPSQRGASGGVINKAWNNVPCMLDCGVTSVGTAITLPAGVAPLANINFDLELGGSISGTVRASLGPVLSLVSVQLFDSSGRNVGSGTSDSLGNYQIDGLVPGSYFARTSNLLDLQDLLFGGAICGANCNPLNGNAITVSGVALTPAIDFNLPQTDPLFKNGFE